MGWFSSACSFVGSVVSGVCSAACSVVKSVGSALTTFSGKAIGIAGSLATKAAGFIGMVATLPLGPLGPIAGSIIQQLIIHLASKAIEYLAKKLGIIEERDKVEEIGYRVEEAQEHDDWKRQEDFKSFEEYYAYLKEQIPDDKIDRKRLAAHRTEYTVFGMIELTNGLENRMGIKMPEEFLFEIGRSRMESNEILAIVDAFKFLGNDTLTREENIKIEDALLVSLRKYYPDKDDDYFYERLGVMRMASRDDMKLAEVYEDKLTDENIKRIEHEGKIPEDL